MAPQTPRFRGVLIEASFALGALLVLFYFLRGMLFFGTTTLTHDNINWNFSPFYFFADQILNGKLPLWNPFSHAGEPFYPLLAQERLLEPLTIGLVLVGQFFTRNIEILFNWHNVSKNLFALFGIYLLFRPLTKYVTVRFLVIIILLFSSMMLSPFRQNGIIAWFLWIPYITYFYLRIFYFNDFRWRNWVALAGTIGINFQCYYLSSVCVYLLCLIIGSSLFYSSEFFAVFRVPSNLKKGLATLGLLFLMLLPNLSLLYDQNHFVFPARSLNVDYKVAKPLENTPGFEGNMADNNAGISMEYDAVLFSGTQLTLWNFIQLISPDGNWLINSMKRYHPKWGKPAEAYLYLGILPWFIALIGMFFGQHTFRRLGLLVFFFFSLLSLGPPGGLHRVLHFIFPPLWFIRHMALFSLYIQFAILYFFILGCNYLATHLQPKIITRNDLLWSTVSALLWSLGFGFLAQQDYPARSYHFVGLGLLAAVFLFIKRKASRQALCGSFIAANLFLVFYFTPDRSGYTFFLLTTTLTPICIAAFLKSSIGSRAFSRITSQRILSLTLVGFLALDLFVRFYETQELYGVSPVPSQEFTFSKEPLPLSGPPRLRIASELQSPKMRNHYPELLSRQSYAFSAIANIGEGQDAFEKAITGTRLDTYFELKNYFRLINFNVPAVTLKPLFLLNETPVQFKGGKYVPDQDFPGFLKRSPPKAVAQYLEKHILLQEPTEQNSIGTSQAEIQYLPNYDHKDFSVRVTTPTSGFLYWANGFDRWWKATVDGQPVPVLRANYAFKAVGIAPGEHDVRFYYDPIFFKWALVFFFAAFAITAIGMIFEFKNIFISLRQDPI